MKQDEKILAKRKKFIGNLFTIWDTDIQFGQQVATWEQISLNGFTKSVMVIPITKDKKIILIQKFCPASKTYEYVLPGGKVEKKEKLKQTALRELIEEIGLKPKNLIPLGSFKILPAYLVGTTYGFIGKNLIKDNKSSCEELEHLEISSFSPKEILKMIKNRKIRDARTVAILLYFFSFHQTKKKI